MSAMTKTSFLVPLFLATATTAASAGGQAGSLGVGVEAQLSGITGLSMNYDAGRFHAGGVLRYYDPAGADNAVFEIAGRFYYHLHSTAMADFGLGSGLGIASIDRGGNNRDNNVYLEPGFQIRMFVASNVALSFTGGILVGLADAREETDSGLASGVDITGQFNGIAGVHYYFF